MCFGTIIFYVCASSYGIYPKITSIILLSVMCYCTGHMLVYSYLSSSRFRQILLIFYVHFIYFISNFRWYCRFLSKPSELSNSYLRLHVAFVFIFRLFYHRQMYLVNAITRTQINLTSNTCFLFLPDLKLMAWDNKITRFEMRIIWE